MSKEVIYVNSEDCDSVIRNILKRNDVSHMDAIKAQMKSMTLLLSFLFDTDQYDAFHKHFIQFEEVHQQSFALCYTLLDEFEREIKSLIKNGENTK